MPYYEEYPFGKMKEATTQDKLCTENRTRGPVYSANGSFNPTSLAINNCLKDIFDEFEPMVTGKLLLFKSEEDDEPSFESP